MPIDRCPHTFDHLAKVVLPGHFLRLQAAINAPIAAEALVGIRSATRQVLSRLHLAADFPGCYILLDGKKPIYVGISRRVIRRLVQHLNYRSHYAASLVYRMACIAYPHEMRRSEAMRDAKFQEAFHSAQGRLHRMRIAFIPIENDLELYLFEVFASMKLDTHVWNTFRTH
jgi:predicted GIY-YIG superfamily endonuclease